MKKKNSIGDQIEIIEGLLNHSVNYVTRFLHNQVDYAVVRNQAIQKAYKQELIDKQNEEFNDMGDKSKNLSFSRQNANSAKPSLVKRTDTNLTKKSTKSVVFNLVNAN